MTLAQGSFSPPRGKDKREYVREMFTAIAPRYDFLNHLLSLNIDRSWRRRAVRCLAWETYPAATYLDLCAGTLDLAVELGRQPAFAGRVIGADFTVPMLARGVGKHEAVVPVGADAEQLPFPDRAFAGCTVGFGVRNLADLDRGLREMARVIRPGGRLVVLEFTTPVREPIRSLYLWYFRRLLPLAGRLISRHREAYSYLPDSVLRFPDPPSFADRMRAAGFDGIGQEPLTLGIAMLHWGVRP